jgi:hypothetical protein
MGDESAHFFHADKDEQAGVFRFVGGETRGQASSKLQFGHTMVPFGETTTPDLYNRNTLGFYDSGHYPVEGEVSPRSQRSQGAKTEPVRVVPTSADEYHPERLAQLTKSKPHPPIVKKFVARVVSVAAERTKAQYPSAAMLRAQFVQLFMSNDIAHGNG